MAPDGGTAQGPTAAAAAPGNSRGSQLLHHNWQDAAAQQPTKTVMNGMNGTHTITSLARAAAAGPVHATLKLAVAIKPALLG
jgi:hypothetical protein